MPLKFSRIVFALPAAVAAGSLMFAACKTRSPQTIQVTPTPPAVTPGDSQANASGNDPYASDPYNNQGTYNQNPTANQSGNPQSPGNTNTASNNQPGTAPTTSTVGHDQTTTGQTTVQATPTTGGQPSSTGASQPPSSSTTTQVPSCDSSNNFGLGFGQPFQSGSQWVAYVDSSKASTCAILPTQCSQSANGGLGYGAPFCDGNLTLAKNQVPTATDAKNDTICVVSYTANSTCPASN